MSDEPDRVSELQDTNRRLQRRVQAAESGVLQAKEVRLLRSLFRDAKQWAHVARTSLEELDPVPYAATTLLMIERLGTDSDVECSDCETLKAASLSWAVYAAGLRGALEWVRDHGVTRHALSVRHDACMGFSAIGMTGLCPVHAALSSVTSPPPGQLEAFAEAVREHIADELNMPEAFGEGYQERDLDCPEAGYARDLDPAALVRAALVRAALARLGGDK